MTDKTNQKSIGDDGPLTENITVGDEIKKKEILKFSKWVEPDTAHEDLPSAHYDVAKGWKALFALPSCQQIMITVAAQKALDIVVGINVTQEFPWRHVPLMKLREIIFDHIENGTFLFEAMRGYDADAYILVGYAPLLTQNSEDVIMEEPFIFYVNSEDAKLALVVIRNIERYERWVINRRLVKKPKRWVTLGSENEIDLSKECQGFGPVTIEVQSVYPLKIPASKEFSFRKCGDVRDGYIELVPTELMKFDNIQRRRITVGIQSSPTCVDLEQQTDPTFPKNAWSQYYYEIHEGEDILDESSEEEESADGRKASRVSTPNAQRDSKAAGTGKPLAEPIKSVKGPPEMSDVIKLLLKTLEFNEIDMYRNDYALISDMHVEHFTNPYLEETLCFANISKSVERYVCGIDWYPVLSGLIVASYTFTTPATMNSVSDRVDKVQRAVLQPNPILMWSFSDNLNIKLEFESPQEVTTLSFCPHNHNLLLAGGINGQILLWDLQNRADKLDYEEILTAGQTKYRTIIGEFLNWTIHINEETIIPPATKTSLESSQGAAITNIYWLGHRTYINSYGKLYLSPDVNATFKFFVTTAMDGSVSFWNLDALTDKKVQSSSAPAQPKALMQGESAYKNKILKPVFTVGFNEPITAIVIDSCVFKCIVTDSVKKRKLLINYGIKMIPTDPNEARQSMVVSTFYGHIERLNWMGIYSESDGREMVSSSSNFARVHDGPILLMKKNPFYPQVFASIGRTVFAVWKEDYSYSPIFWRKRSCDLTTLAWSEDRPGMLFITRSDGYFEAWDILARDDDACFNDILGGGIITAISEHRPAYPEKLLGIGDYNSSFRMVKLPPTFYIPLYNENIRFKEYIWKEEGRKKSIQAWEQRYYETNKETIEAKRQAEIDAHKELDRIEKEHMLQVARKAKQEAEGKADEPIAHLPYSERMRRQWEELNMSRLMAILMSRKRVNAEQLEIETTLEKRYLAYEAAKKESYARVLQQVGEEVATIRSRLLPAEVPDLQRNELILTSTENVMELADTYENIVQEAGEVINGFDTFPDIEYIDFLDRGKLRRQLLIKSLGGNTERLYWFESSKGTDMLDECSWEIENFVNAVAPDNNEEVDFKEESIKPDLSMVPSETTAIPPEMLE